MANIKNAFDEPWIHIWLLVIFAFLSINYNDRIALIYTIMIITSLSLWFLEKTSMYKPKVPFNLPNTSIKSIGIAAVVMVAFVAISILVTSIFQNLNIFNINSVSGLASVFNTWAASNPTTLILSNDAWITLVTFGLFIPVVETVLVVKLFYALIEIMNLGAVTLRNGWLWLLGAVFGVGSVWFHIQAKQITNNTALLLVFLFFYISVMMTIPTKETESPVYLHIINNVMATLKQVKLW